MVLRNRQILPEGDSEALAGRYDFRRHHVDVLCGGFPCQDISNAGQRTGISGERSGLWRYMVRAVRVVRPKFLIVENVAALLGRGMGTVLGDLAESGYDSEWDCLSVVAFGLSHIRERTWIVSYPTGKRWNEVQIFSKTDFASETKSRGKRYDPRVVPCEGPGGTLYGFPDSSIIRSFDGFPDWVDRLTSLGNAVVPQIIEWIGKRIMSSLEQP